MGKMYVKNSSCRWALLFSVVLPLTVQAAEDEKAALAQKAQGVLKAHCYRCHGQDGAVEGGMNYILDLPRLVARKKVIPGSADTSPLYKKIANGKMPPPDEKPRPSAADLAVLKQWIDAGAPGTTLTADRTAISEADVFALILADLEKLDKRSRRFTRYFTLAPLYNAGLGEDELQTYRHALAKLINSLSWHPRITVPQVIDPARVVLRIDLRDFQWDANLWNRLLAEYPYGILQDTSIARACTVLTATKLPCLRADWFVANASRPPIYHELLQLPNNLTELERQLRVDAAVNIQQERVARAGFNGSGIAKNNRILERHDAVHGAYWRSYDFDAVPQNLVERDTLLPDRRNVFAYPLGPGVVEYSFQHAGGEVIWNLPNGLQAYMLVNANNLRVDKAPTAIVGDPKRPDKAVENGVSCMSCHYRGINPKDDQIRDYAQKNPKAFSRADAELIQSLYVPKEKMKALMDEDAERFRKAVEKTGGRISAFEPVMTMTLRYEADVDLPTAAAEVGLKPEEFLDRLGRTESLARNLGSLRTAGGTVQRQVFIQAFADIVREMRLGIVFQPALVAQSLPDNTGEIDPLEGISSPANSMAFSTDGKRALFASADKTVRLWDVDAGRELRRFVGHTASVWSVAFAPDGRTALSGSADRTVRLWDVETGQELRRLQGHTDLVTSVAFSPDGKKALSGSFDHSVILWDLEKLRPVRNFPELTRYINHVSFAPDGRRIAIGGERIVFLIDGDTGKELSRFEGHRNAVTCVAFMADGQKALSGSDDQTMHLWDVASGKSLRTFVGHTRPVQSVALSPDGLRALSGSSDDTVRLWEVESGRELRRFEKHIEPVIRVAFLPEGRQTLSGSRDAIIRVWELAPASTETPKTLVPTDPIQTAPVKGSLRPAAVIPVGGTIPSLLLSPNGKWLYYLNAVEGKVGRVNTAMFKRDHELKLADGTETLALTRNGKTLFATTSSHSKIAASGQIQLIDPLKMELRKTLRSPVEFFDLAARDDDLVYLSGIGADWTDILGLNVTKETIGSRWGGVWTRSFLKLSADQKRLYYSTQGVSPGYIEALLIPSKSDEKPVTYRAAARPDQPLGGDFLLTTDGKFLLCKTGTVLRLSATRAEDLQYVTLLEPFLTAVTSAELGAAFVLAEDGSLKHYSYPEFKLQGTYRLGGVAYQAALDGISSRLYVAAFDPKSLSVRPRSPNLGDIHVYDLKELLPNKNR